MARGTQLQQLVEMLRAETGRSDNVSAGRNEESSLKRRLRATQERLYQSFDWPFLKVQATKNMAAGQRYYDWPTTVNSDRIEKVQVLWNNTWYPVCRGIGPDQYNSYNSLNDERSDPVLKFDVRSIANAEQIEIWPIPASNAPVLHVWGLRPLRALVANNDLADLDDNLIVWTLGAKMLARQKSADAPAMLKDANDLYAKLTGNSKAGGENLSLLGGAQKPRVVGTIIRVA